MHRFVFNNSISRMQREYFCVYEKTNPQKEGSSYGAENETRTRDPNLGKVVLYQLSYFRTIVMCPRQESNLHVSQHSHLKRARLPFRHVGSSVLNKYAYGAENETRTRDPNLGKVVLYQLSYFRIAVTATLPLKSGAKVALSAIHPKFFRKKIPTFSKPHKKRARTRH